MTTSIRYFIGFVSIIAAISGIYLTGYHAGKTSAENTYNAQQLKQLSKVIDSTKDLTKEAREASAAIEVAVAKVLETNIKTTRNLNDALKKTAPDRANCTYDSDIMQQLEGARYRAARATTATYTDNKVPATSSTNKQPR